VRHAFLYPVRPGCGAALARLLAEHDAAAVADPAHALVGATRFLRDDTLVRMVDLHDATYREALEQAAGFAPGSMAEEISRQLDLEAGTDVRSLPAIERFLTGCCMDPVTDRRAQDA